jgi:hypothetical protein
MSVTVNRYIGSNGEVLIPLNQNATNSANLVSSRGVYYIAQTTIITTPLQGNPMGLLLALTYASDQ